MDSRNVIANFIIPLVHQSIEKEVGMDIKGQSTVFRIYN